VGLPFLEKANQFFENALILIKPQIEKGDPEAIYIRGVMYHNGYASPVDLKEALGHYSLAAEKV
jgi:TPR repeat protein